MEIIFHIFGNIYFRTPMWSRVSSLAKGIPASYILCSEKFVKLTRGLYPKDFHEAFSFYPLSCDSNFSYEKNSLLKKKIGLELDSKIILYTGRISPSKNIDGIINICEGLRELRKDFTLLLIGTFDDYNHYDLQPDGSYQAFITALIKNVNSADEFIKYIPYQEEIKPYYDISDAFISISTMDSDDYGLSICEALSNGLETFLTDWAGYSSFRDYEGVKLFEVSHNDGQVEFDEHKIIRSLDNSLSQIDNSLREKRSTRNIKMFKKNSMRSDYKFLKQERILVKKANLKQLSFSSNSLKLGDVENYYNHLRDLF